MSSYGPPRNYYGALKTDLKTCVKGTKLREHEKLIKEREKWMKGTAKCYTLAAALIATVVFAAAITIPGGNHDDTGIPNFTKEKAFKVFAASDALSLLLSIASVLICLSILTARYAEDDFLFALPRSFPSLWN
uniref:PGG domain-containing protein n=1 Tax=Vitis vinifera TaxID=29760 RepID=F6I4Y8_VITVI